MNVNACASSEWATRRRTRGVHKHAVVPSVTAAANQDPDHTREEDIWSAWLAAAIMTRANVRSRTPRHVPAPLQCVFVTCAKLFPESGIKWGKVAQREETPTAVTLRFKVLGLCNALASQSFHPRKNWYQACLPRRTHWLAHSLTTAGLHTDSSCVHNIRRSSWRSASWRAGLINRVLYFFY